MIRLAEKKNSLIFCCCSTTESPFPHSLNACFCDCIMRLLCAMKISVLLNANKKTAHNFFFLSVFEPLNKPFAIAHSEKFNCTKGKDVQNIWARNTHTNTHSLNDPLISIFSHSSELCLCSPFHFPSVIFFSFIRAFRFLT